MTREEIFAEVKELLVEEFEVKEELITPKASFYDDLGLDSLDAIDLVISLNKNYDIDIDNESTEELRTIESLVHMVENNISK